MKRGIGWTSNRQVAGRQTRPSWWTRQTTLLVLTWTVWLGGNLTMAAWLHEHNERRINRAVVVNLVNAAMCAATLALVVWLRF